MAIKARAFHSSALLRKVDVVKAAMPQSLREKAVAERGNGALIIPQKQLEKRSAEFWKFLSSEAKYNPEVVEFQKAVEEFRKGATDKKAPQVLIIKGSMPKVDAKDSRRFVFDHSLSSSTREMSREERMKKAKEQELNLDFLQIIFHLCGMKIFDNSASSYPAVIIITNTETQHYHCDGHPKTVLNKDGAKEVVSRISANALFAIETDPRLRVLTSFIKIDDIIEKLSPQALEILQKPIFIGLVSQVPTYYPKPHPILQNKDDVWNLLYPDGAVDVFVEKGANLDEEEQKKITEARGALVEFRKVIAEMEKDNIFSTELGIDGDDNPDAILIFHDGRVAHRRFTEVKSLFENLSNPESFLKGFWDSRVAVSLAAQDNLVTR